MSTELANTDTHAASDAHGVHDVHGTHDGHNHATPVRPGDEWHITHEMRHHIEHEVVHFCHMLSEQGPMSVTFVHNNTLLGLQHMHFEAAIAESYRYQNGQGYWPNDRHRGFYAVGRITDEDIAASIKSRPNLSSTEGETLATVGGRAITAGEVYRIHMIRGINALDEELLRYESEDGNAMRTFRQDVPEATRSVILSKSASELTATLGRVGRDWTMAHWLQAHTSLDVPNHLRVAVRHHLADTHGHYDELGAAKAIEACLRALAVPSDRWDAYLACIDKSCAAESLDEAKRTQIRSLWLRDEVTRAETLAHRHWGIRGTFGSIGDYFGKHPEQYAVLSLWQTSLVGYGITDPLSPSDPHFLQEQDPDGGLLESLSDRFVHMERWGGAPIPLTPELHQAIERVVKKELEQLQARAEGGDVPALESAHLCWVVLHDLGGHMLNRRGFEAFEALLSLVDTPDAAALMAQLQQNDPKYQMLESARKSLGEAIASFKHGRVHSDFIQQLTGVDVVENVNRYMIKICAAFFDEALAAWHMPGRGLGFYDAWKALAEQDHSFDFDELGSWRDALHQLPILSEDAVIRQLVVLGIAEKDWGEYLGRVLVRLKGWAGMVFWRQLNPKYSHQKVKPIDVLEYLAVRMFYETLLVRKICRNTWQIDVNVGSLERYFETHLSEFFVRHELYRGVLPEYLVAEARVLVAERSYSGGDEDNRWKALADKIWAYDQAMVPRREGCDRVWRLFHLAQFLGLSAGEVRALSVEERDRLFGALEAFPESTHGPVWLIAFERHYRDQFLNALALNRGKGRWMKRDKRPKAQIYFCIDDREESMHRHLGELDPEYETLGAAGFFGMAIDYTGLDDHEATPLCPQVVTPAHRILEVARPEEEHTGFPVHQKGSKWHEVYHDAYWETKRNLVASYFLVDVVGFMMVIPLIGRILFRNKFEALMVAGKQMLVPPVSTKIIVNKSEHDLVHSGEKPLGFTDVEQADRLEGLLRNTGLTHQFARLVVVAGHGSHSMNNPHENAHDCGACGGKHGYANARVVAAIANRQVIRDMLRARGIDIPDDSWFIGSLHNTCHEGMTYGDLENIPATHQEEWQRLKADLDEARTRSAHERCRRFGSSPKDATNAASLKHIEGRSMDLSQVRPEWGHATNGFAVVGRRSITQGVFFDRRPFIISYDASVDPTGKILERVLLAVGPVGAGINLEYYFSTVDTKIYGSDTKVPHNVSGMVGVMAGAHSDLQTGLPMQMTEVHEAMRLQLLVEAPMAILGEIYGRQPAIQQLLDGQWVHLIAVCPDTGAFNLFVPGVGFVLWDEPLKPIPTVKASAEWYRGQYENFLPPAFITEPTGHWTGSKDQLKANKGNTHV